MRAKYTHRTKLKFYALCISPCREQTADRRIGSYTGAYAPTHSERKMLEQPEVKIATRNMFYDEQGKHRRTKKEVLDEQGNLRAGCSIIPKGEVYESHIFTKKDEWFKNKAFTKEVKELFTDTINRYVKEESEKLSVFQQGGVYLATKKIGKNNPKAEEIKADNAARQEWNRTVDVALVEGVPEEDILKIKQEKIADKTLQSIRTHGWLPDKGIHTQIRIDNYR